MQKTALTSVPVIESNATAAAAQPTRIDVSNSQSSTVKAVDGIVVHAVPTLDGFGLLIVSLLLGAAAFWIWRRQQ